MSQALLYVQRGRSMLEMLAVLVIIGVLSITSIAIYQVALTRYYVNETINEVHLRSVIISNSLAASNFVHPDEMEPFTRLKYPVSVTVNPNNTFDLILNHVPARVCQGIMKETKHLAQSIFIKRDGTCTASEYINGLTFRFDNDLSSSTLPEVFPDEPQCHSDDDCINMCGVCKNGLCQTRCTAQESCYAQSCQKPTCTTDADCALTPTTPHCQIFSNPTRNQCVRRGCASNKDCSGTTPYCLLTAGDYYGTCVECILDDQCPYHYCAVGNDGKNTCQKPQLCAPTAAGMSQAYCEEICQQNWNGHACCPTDISTLTSIESCQQCRGIWAYDMCHPANYCQTDVFGKTTASKWLCEECGGYYNEKTKECTASECKTNSDCTNNEFCSIGTDTSNYYGNYQKCRKISDYTPINVTLVHNNKKESWILSGASIPYWDAINWCRAQGKSLQSRDTVQSRWQILGSVGNHFQVYVYTHTSADSTRNYIVNLSSGYAYASPRNYSSAIHALCQ